MTQPLTTVVGRTERALGALLLDVLAGSPVHGNDEWVALVVAAGSPGPGLSDALTAALRSRRAATTALESLHRNGIIDEDRLSPVGERVLADLRAQVAVRTAALVEGLDPADVAATVRVLDALRERAAGLVDRTG